MQQSENQVIVEQESSKIEKKQWVTPGVDTFTKQSIQSGGQPLLESQSIIGALSS